MPITGKNSLTFCPAGRNIHTGQCIHKLAFSSVPTVGDKIDFHDLETIVERAEEKLRRSPVVIPTTEHRDFHLSIYRKLNNPYVFGLLESYWELYKAAGFEIYPDMEYVNRIWQYHRKTVDLINARQYELAYQALMEHMRYPFPEPAKKSSAFSIHRAERGEKLFCEKWDYPTFSLCTMGRCGSRIHSLHEPA